MSWMVRPSTADSSPHDVAAPSRTPGGSAGFGGSAAVCRPELSGQSEARIPPPLSVRPGLPQFLTDVTGDVRSSRPKTHEAAPLVWMRRPLQALWLAGRGEGEPCYLCAV